MANNQLFGHELPFPRQDLYVALVAVLVFIPAVVVLNALVRSSKAVCCRPLIVQAASVQRLGAHLHVSWRAAAAAAAP